MHPTASAADACFFSQMLLVVGFVYGAGAETLIFVTGTSAKYPKLFVSRQKNQSQLWIPPKSRKIGVRVSGGEIQTSAVDTRTAVWVSTPEKFSKIVLGKTWNFSRKFRNPAVSTRELFVVVLTHAAQKCCSCTPIPFAVSGKPSPLRSCLPEEELRYANTCGTGLVL